MLESIERTLSSDTERARNELDGAFDRFERTQAQLADRITALLSRPLDETALALGYFLTISIWLAFERAFGDRLKEVTHDVLSATEAALNLEEELRASHAEEPIDLEDVVAQEQPAVLTFVNAHIEAALDLSGRANAGETEDDVDVDDVHLVYRMMLVLTLALSHAVAPEGDRPKGHGTSEMLA